MVGFFSSRLQRVQEQRGELGVNEVFEVISKGASQWSSDRLRVSYPYKMGILVFQIYTYYALEHLRFSISSVSVLYQEKSASKKANSFNLHFSYV